MQNKILNFVNVVSLFCNYFPWKKDVALYSKKLEFTKGCFASSFLKFARWFWRRYKNFIKSECFLPIKSLNRNLLSHTQKSCKLLLWEGNEFWKSLYLNFFMWVTGHAVIHIQVNDLLYYFPIEKYSNDYTCIWMPYP